MSADWKIRALVTAIYLMLVHDASVPAEYMTSARPRITKASMMGGAMRPTWQMGFS
jgi:hypothetical protein